MTNSVQLKSKHGTFRLTRVTMYKKYINVLLPIQILEFELNEKQEEKLKKGFANCLRRMD